MVKYFDIHSHVQFSAYDGDRNDVIKRSLDSGVGMINIGTQKKTSEDAVVLANKYPEGVYASIGLHPIHTDHSYMDKDESPEDLTEIDFDHDLYKKLALDPKVVAIGECGLDFYHLDENSKEKQIEIFKKHIELALEINKPLMLHVREAYKEVLDILGEYKKAHGDKLQGNVHFFAGDIDTANKFLDLGFTLSFTGVITYPRSTKPGMCDYEEIIKNVPIEMIMAETDAPYVAPVPYRGKRNEPSYVIEVVKRIAEIKGLDAEETAKILIQNTKRIFEI